MRSRPRLPEPTLGRVEQRARHLGVVLALEEAEQPPVVLLEVVQVAIDMRADPAHRLPVAPGQEQLHVRVAEERVLPAVQEGPPLGHERRDPVRLVTIEPHRELDEAREVAPRGDRLDLDRHARQPSANGRPCHHAGRIRESSRPRAARADRLCAPRGPDPVLPAGGVRGRPRRDDGGARAADARLQQLPRPDRPPAREGGRARGARALRHRAHRLAADERHDSAASRARGGDRGLDAAPRTRLSSRPATRRISVACRRS